MFNLIGQAQDIINLEYKSKNHESAVTCVDFVKDYTGKLKGFLSGGFDPVVVMHRLEDGSEIERVNLIAAPFVWNSKLKCLIGRDKLCTREIRVL